MGGFWEAKTFDFRIFFDDFFGVNFAARFGRAKNRPQKPNKTQKAQTWLGAPGVPRLLGRDKREGKSEISEDLEDRSF